MCTATEREPSSPKSTAPTRPDWTEAVAQTPGEPSGSAAALGIQKASVYSHIKGKQDLLAEIALAGADAFHAALDQIPPGNDPADQLRLALRAHLDVVDRQLDVATVWLHEWRYLVGPPRKRFMAERRRYQQRIRALFAQAVESGALRPDLDIDRATLAFLSIGNWAYTWMTHQTDVALEADSFWSLLLDRLANG